MTSRDGRRDDGGRGGPPPVVDRPPRRRGGLGALVGAAVLFGLLAVAVQRPGPVDLLVREVMALLDRATVGDAPSPAVEQGGAAARPAGPVDRLHALMREGDAAAARQLAATLDAADLDRVVGGMTAVMLAASVGDPDLVRALLERGADPNRRGSGDRTALQYAAEKNRIAAGLLLLDAGADIDGVDETRLSPLVMTAERGFTEFGLLLIQRGADVDLQHVQGWTALIDAAQYGNVALVKALLAAGAALDPEVNGWTAAALARRNGHEEVVRLIEKARRVRAGGLEVEAR